MLETALSDIVVVNESSDEAEPGYVSVFRNEDAACSWLEHWWVEDGEGSAFTADGHRVILGVDWRSRVIVTGKESVPDGQAIVRRWLLAAAAAVLQARKIKAAKGEIALSEPDTRDLLPHSTEELIAYIGFTA